MRIIQAIVEQHADEVAFLWGWRSSALHAEDGASYFLGHRISD
jgi:hypothetical protein